MTKKINKKAQIAGAGLIVAGLIGGSTLALWSDSAEVTGGTITAGNMDIATTGGTWHDISTADGTKATIADADAIADGRVIDLAAFRTVPGDTIAGFQAFDVDLEGDNLVAELSVDLGDDATGTLLAGENAATVLADKGVTLETVLFDANGAIVGTGSGATSEVTFVSPEFAALAGAGTAGYTLPANAVVAGAGADDLSVGVVAYFDVDTSDSVREEATAILAASTVSLEQVRN